MTLRACGWRLATSAGTGTRHRKQLLKLDVGVLHRLRQAGKRSPPRSTMVAQVCIVPAGEPPGRCRCRITWAARVRPLTWSSTRVTYRSRDRGIHGDLHRLPAAVVHHCQRSPAGLYRRTLMEWSARSFYASVNRVRRDSHDHRRYRYRSWCKALVPRRRTRSAGHITLRSKFNRGQLIQFVANHAACLIGNMETCCGSTSPGSSRLPATRSSSAGPVRQAFRQVADERLSRRLGDPGGCRHADDALRAGSQRRAEMDAGSASCATACCSSALAPDEPGSGACFSTAESRSFRATTRCVASYPLGGGR